VRFVPEFVGCSEAADRFVKPFGWAERCESDGEGIRMTGMALAVVWMGCNAVVVLFRQLGLC